MQIVPEFGNDQCFILKAETEYEKMILKYWHLDIDNNGISVNPYENGNLEFNFVKCGKPPKRK